MMQINRKEILNVNAFLLTRVNRRRIFPWFLQLLAILSPSLSPFLRNQLVVTRTIVLNSLSW